MGAPKDMKFCEKLETHGIFNPLDTNVKFDACVPTGVLLDPSLEHSDKANFRPQNKA